MNQTPAQRGPTIAAILGYGGVIPFAALAFAILLAGPAWRDLALRAFLGYSAVILSFLGGIRWGAAARATLPRAGEYVLAVLPSLWAWGFLLADSHVVATWGLMAGFYLMGLVDWVAPARGMGVWMVRLRLRLTAAVVLCHAVVLVAF